MKYSRLFAHAVMLLIALCLVMGQGGDAEAAKKKRRSVKRSAPQSLGVNDPRYAAIIMNPVTGEVYHQQNVDAKRYPASLTKMMTLYLLFEALEKGKLDLDDRMDVSALAARQPQTNLSLDEGDRIDVETAIESLVVRSANDVSVVVAEHLGGSVENFARRMTHKAQELGMKNTEFRNPNGLPNAEQRTTARDMAKLGIALKRDFPKYYPYFSTLQFSHNGVTYYTHNRVMLRYAGVDGIKTGYIGVSGFNLVTSVTRGGRPLVGVVMGGSSGRWRDNRMIDLLDETYRTIASRGATKGKFYPGNLPLAKPGTAAQGVVNGDPNALETLPAGAASVPQEAVGEEVEIVDNALPAAMLPADRTAIRTPFDAATSAASAPVVSTPAVQVSPPASVGGPAHSWGIQVGAFSTEALAEQAARAAYQAAPKPLAAARLAIIGPAGTGVPVHRARLINLSQTQAREACETMILNKSPCFIFQVTP